LRLQSTRGRAVFCSNCVCAACSLEQCHH
jgi:hypothetical protein